MCREAWLCAGGEDGARDVRTLEPKRAGERWSLRDVRVLDEVMRWRAMNPCVCRAHGEAVMTGKPPVVYHGGRACHAPEEAMRVRHAPSSVFGTPKPVRLLCPYASCVHCRCGGDTPSGVRACVCEW